MLPRQEDQRREPQLCTANACFQHDVLPIHLSEFGEGQEEPSVGIKLWSCVRAVSVIIPGAEIC